MAIEKYRDANDLAGLDACVYKDELLFECMKDKKEQGQEYRTVIVRCHAEDLHKKKSQLGERI